MARFSKKKVLNTKCVFRFSVQSLSDTFFVIRRFEGDVVTNVYLSSFKVLSILVRFKCSLNFINRFSKHLQVPSFMKIRPIGVELLCAGARVDEANSCLFAVLWNAPKY